MNLRLCSRDRLRLDVTMASQGEIFSWPGASHFEEAGIDKVVRSGPMSTGSFSALLIAVFQFHAKTLTFAATKTVGNRLLLEYTFRVPLPDSHYRVKLRDSWSLIGYGGTILVDPETAEVVRMMMVTDELPSESGMCEAATTMDLTTVRFGDGQFLLPKKASNHYVYPNGEETESTITFADCREFHSESTLRFGPYDGSANGGEKSVAQPAIYLECLSRWF